MKFFMHFVAFLITWGLSLCVMLFGWGLRPESWGWVIWGGLGALLLGAVLQVVASHDS